jgi:hypothetical protein
MSLADESPAVPECGQNLQQDVEKLLGRVPGNT